MKMRLQGDTYQYIADTMQVSHGFIAYWQQAYQAQGVAGVKLAYKGSQPYLNAQQQQAVITWLKQRNYWHLLELQHHIEEHYEVVFQSQQSYYNLFKAAGISWKKSQRSNPRKDLELVEKKTANQNLVGSSSSSD